MGTRCSQVLLALTLILSGFGETVCLAQSPGPSLRFNGFIDAGFSFQHKYNLSNPNAAAEQDIDWTINEIEFALEHTASKYISTKIAINFLPGSLPTHPVGVLDYFLQEAFMRVKIPIGKKKVWKFYTEVGRFFAPPGWDAVNTAERYQISASFANQATPNTFTGIKFGLHNDWFDVFAYVINGWDTIADVDLDPMAGIALSMTIGPATIGLSVTNGNEPGAVSVNLRQQNERTTLFDLQLTLNLVNNKLILGAEGFTLLHPDGRYWYGWLFCVHFRPNDKLGFTARTSRFDDPEKLFTNVASQDEFSLAVLIRPQHFFTIMVEYRMDLLGFELEKHTAAIKAIYQF